MFISLLSFALLAFTPIAQPDSDGRILWSAFRPGDMGDTTHPYGFEKSPGEIYGGGAVQIGVDPAKGKYVRSTGAAHESASLDGYNSQRAELVAKFDGLKEGTTIWLGFDFRVRSGTGIATDWQTVMQMPTVGAISHLYPPVLLNVNTHSDRLEIVGHGTGLGAAGDGRLDLGPTPYDRSTRIAIGARVCRRCHSPRRASSGFVLVARRAGT